MAVRLHGNVYRVYKLNYSNNEDSDYKQHGETDEFVLALFAGTPKAFEPVSEHAIHADDNKKYEHDGNSQAEQSKHKVECF